jgi:hypothetical protein
MTCPVCGGQIRSGSKVCPGCRHVFPMPVAQPAAEPARRPRYAIPVIVIFLLTGFGFFYAIADRGTAEENAYVKVDAAELSLAQTQKAAAQPTDAAPPIDAPPPTDATPPTEIAAPPTEAVFEAPSQPIPEAAPNIEAEMAPIEEPKPAKKGREALPTRGPARELTVAEEKKESEDLMKPTGAGARVAESKVEAVALVEEVPREDAQPPTPVERPKLVESTEMREARPIVGKAAIAAVGRIRAGPRAAPVVERSRSADPAVNLRVSRDARRERSCEGRWEGECRQFPDHKPKW